MRPYSIGVSLNPMTPVLIMRERVEDGGDTMKISLLRQRNGGDAAISHGEPKSAGNQQNL